MEDNKIQMKEDHMLLNKNYSTKFEIILKK